MPSPPLPDTTAAFEVFRAHRAELYWLAYLITGDEEKSIAVIGDALETGTENPVFQDFMLSWARKLVIVAALAAIRPQLDQADRGSDELLLLATTKVPMVNKAALETAVLKLDPLPRCAVILTLFERIPTQEACFLLRMDEETVRMARMRGVIELARHLMAAPLAA